MRVLDLFAGIGGFSLAAHWMGWETTAFCEQDPFCQKVLAKNFPGVPIHNDVRNIKEFEKYAGTVELVTGGYPCQPFSVAGKQKGKDDDRHLWPSMLQIIKQIKPSWVVAENVAGHIRMGLDDVLFDLESIDYAASAVVIPACAKNAQHRRDRIWIIAHAQHDGLYGSENTKRSLERSVRNKRRPLEIQQSKRASGLRTETSSKQRRGRSDIQPRSKHLAEPRFCRSLDGIPPALDRDIKIPNRNARIKSLGNSIVPQVAHEIFRAIDAFESEAG